MTIDLEFNITDFQRRLLEILPGLLAWGTFIILITLSFVVPFWIAIFIIAYDTYVLIRAGYMSIYLIFAYLRLRRMRHINWLERCRQSNTDLPWDQIHHIIILPTYDESLAVLTTSLNALLSADFPRERLHVVVGFEERNGLPAHQRAAALNKQFCTSFGTFLTTFHPDGLPGEKRVKSANATWAIKAMEQKLASQHIPARHIVVSNFDSDTAASPNYFAYLTYAFINHPDRYHVSYQPLPMYNNNVWDAPAFSRVIATGSTFWQMIESTRPERLVTFSSHSMSLIALQDVGYWHRDIVSEDSRIFWQCLLHYNGRYRTEPLYTSVSMDAALANTWWQTLRNQYRQKRRWAWGIENFPYMASGFLHNKKIPFRTKAIYSLRTLEGHYSWATTAIIVAGLGWLPIFFGGPAFHSTVLSYSLPYMARTIMSIAMIGLFLSSALTFFLLPPKPHKYTAWRYFPMAFQWVLVPFIATILSSFPALDAETRLMLGRDLSFNVMQKTRRP